MKNKLETMKNADENKLKSEEIKLKFPVFICYNKTLEQQSDFILNSVIMMRVLTCENNVENLHRLAKDIKQHETSDFYSFKNKFENEIKIVIEDEDIKHCGYIDHSICFKYKTELEKNLKLSLVKIYYNIVFDDLIWKDDYELKSLTEMCNKTAEFAYLSITN